MQTAQNRPAASRRWSRSQSGRQVEGLFTLFVLGIVAAIAIPNLLRAKQQVNQKRTMTGMTVLGTALDKYYHDKKIYPDASSIDQALFPTYIKQQPLLDGWRRPFRYECWSSTGIGGCDSYAIGSSGRDGLFQRKSLRECHDGQMGAAAFSDGALATKRIEDFAPSTDIVLANKEFVFLSDFRPRNAANARGTRVILAVFAILLVGVPLLAIALTKVRGS